MFLMFVLTKLEDEKFPQGLFFCQQVVADGTLFWS
jgi:hypothetical protein